MQCTFQKLLSSLSDQDGSKVDERRKNVQCWGKRGSASDAESARGLAKDHTFPYNLEDFWGYH